MKEEEKAAIKALVEVENADRENQIHALRKQLDEQKQLLDGQRKLLNELQVLCEFTQNDIIKANRELHKEEAQTEQLIMQYQETDQATTTLKAKHGQLENQLNGMRQPKKIEEPGEDQENMPPPGFNWHGYPIMPKKRTKSYHSMFNA